MKKRYLIAIAFLILFSFIMFLFTHFTDSTIIATDGYVVSGEQLSTLLLSNKKNVRNGTLKLVKVSGEDRFYNNLNKTYVGEEKKKEVNTTYPIFSNRGVAVVNLSSDSKLINDKFEYFNGYENFTLTGGKLYNNGDLTQSDYENYILLQLSNMTYVNLYKIKLETLSYAYDIPLNSIINFEDGYIKYYYYKEGKLLYKCIDGVDRSSKITIDNKSIYYETLLVHIGKLDEKDVSITPEDDDLEEEYIIEDNKNNSSSSNSNKDDDSNVVKYIKPTVKCSDFTTNVYSATTRLSISDPSRVISGGINFQFKIGDRIFLRKVFVTSGQLEIVGLVPNTEFTIVGTYKYYNEEKKKMEATFFEQKVTTLGVENLDAISLDIKNGAVYSNKLELSSIKITSDLKSETIKGVSKAIIYINDDRYSLSSTAVNSLLKGQEVSYSSPPKLASHSELNYKIELLDNFGNVIKVTNSTGVSRTSKKVPTSFVKVEESTVNSTSFSVTTKNDDSVLVNNYRYVIYNKDMEIIQEEKLDNTKNVEKILLKDLNPNTVYTIRVLGNYDIEDGNGTSNNNIMGESKFTTMPLSSLGYVRVIAKTNDITSNSTSFETNIDLTNVSSILIELMNSFTITVKNDNDVVIYKKKLTGNELEQFKTGGVYLSSITGLNSVEEYFVSYDSTVKQGSVTENISVLSAFKKFKTYKEDAAVLLRNKFVNGSMIDFDVKVSDRDGAIESDRVLLEIRDENEKLVAMETLGVNDDYKQLNYTKLDANKRYTFTYKVEEYNVGYDNSTYEGDYVLFREIITTEEGIKGSIEMDSLLRQITSKNLFNIADYSRIRTEGAITTAKKEYDLKNKEVTFSAKNGWTNFSYFLPEAYKYAVTVTFKAKYDKDTPNKAPVYLSNSYGSSGTYRLNDLEEKNWKEYKFTFTMSGSYIGFLISETANLNQTTSVIFKDIQIVSDDLTLNENAKTDVTLSYHNSGRIFTDMTMKGGNELMPSHRTGEDTTVGNYGDGYARITNLTTNTVTDFSYTGGPQSYITSSTGKYKVELWGAGGGDGSGTGGKFQDVASHGGRGSYTSGIIQLSSNFNLYIYVGGQGKYGSGVSSFGGPVGGFNGGGNGGNSASGSGGGATDVRLTSGVWNNKASLESRIMVAAGGGGADNYGGTLNGNDDGSGGPGGALISIGAYINGVLNPQYFATQTSGAAFGVGGNATVRSDTGGGGGGYYGGIVTNNGNGGASGGSSYISGYKGCVAYDKKRTDDSSYKDYSEKDSYKGTFNINIADTKNEIVTNDFYIRIYKGNELVDTIKYDLNDDNTATIIDSYQLTKNKSYTLKLSVKIRDRFYDISELSFNTNEEIRTITTTGEFYAMHPSGKYIVLNDLDFTRIGTVYSAYFYGDLDFQGHTLTFNVIGRSSYLFHTISASAKIRNLVLDVNLDNTSSVRWWRGFTYRNYGTIDNLMINILSSNSQPNYVFSLMGEANYGTIKNFVINCEASFSAKAASGILVWSNQGTIKNGYVYGENIKAYFENAERSRKDIGSIAGEATTNSRIENVFSLINVETDTSASDNTQVGNLIGYSATGTLQNAYSVEDPNKTNTNLANKDPNIGQIGAINAKNLFYSSDNTYNSNYSDKISKLALQDVDFQKKILNTDEEAFNVDSFVSLGYYPQLKLNDCMPNQEWIALPKVTDSDLIDVTSVEEVSNDGDSATVILNINNPAAEKIKSVGIANITTVEILKQEDTWGKTKLTVKLSNPTKYTSKYYIRLIISIGALGGEYETKYGEYERGINIDLYYPIHNLQEFKMIRETPTQNYILMDDIDFKGSTINNYMITGTFSGKLNGNGHTLKNLTVTSGNGFINKLTGTIKNLNVENFSKTNNTGYAGFIYNTGGNAIVDNVHLRNVKLKATVYLGGIVSYGSDVTISNSSVVGFVNDTAKDLMDVRIGGIAGYLSNSYITNCYVQDIDVSITDSQSTYGIGGIIGQMGSGTIDNVYATGNLRSNSSHVGGIVGYGNIKLTNAWSNVDIVSELDYIGGIFGRTDSSNISNTLVTGSIYSSYPGLNIHRTTGNVIAMQNNYAWEGQQFYGYVTGDASGELLLTDEQIKDINTYYDLVSFGGNFDYSDIGNLIMPKIKNVDNIQILPGQKDSKLEREKFEVLDVQIESTVTNATILIVLDNPNNLNVTGITFDNLEISKTNLCVTQDGKTTINVQVVPKRYYDSYSLTGVTYTEGDGTKPISYSKVVKIDLQFYKTISKYEDWQSISTITTENYRLSGDIDFIGKKNVNTNVSMARLEGQGDGYSLKNLTIDITSGNFALIRKITTSLKNVTFDNITIKNTGSGDYVNVIKLNYADMSSINFNNITISAPKSNYVGPVGQNRGQDLKNISINHNDIKGVNYVGGFCSYSYNYGTYGFTADDVTIYATGQYVGGMFGYKAYANPATSFYHKATNMHVTGKSDVGGMFGYGNANYSEISDSTVVGLSSGNYIGGMSGRFGIYYANSVIGRNLTVIANDNNYVGGLAGWTYDLANAYLYDSTITQKSSSKAYVGGIVGYKNGYTHQIMGITNCVITNAGNTTGGIVGNLYGSLHYTYAYNVEVNGVDRVGGISGFQGGGSQIAYNITNAKVVGSGSSVGGAIGYLNSVHESDAAYSGRIYDMILANVDVTGSNYVGGVIGSAPRQLTNNFFHRILAAVNVQSTLTTNPFIGPVTGFDSRFLEEVPRMFMYQSSKINGELISNITTYNSIPKANFATATNMKTQSYYVGKSFITSRWDYTGLASGYYPKVKNASAVVLPDQSNVVLPTGAVTYRMRMATPLSGHELPTLNVYSSGINTLNLEFSDKDQYSYFEVYENDTKVFAQDIDERVFSIQYNYSSSLKIVVSDGINRRVYLYNAEKLNKKITTFDNKYAYIYEGNLKGNIKNTPDKFIHIYGDLALTDNYSIYDLSSGKFISRDNLISIDLLKTPVSLYSFKYDDTVIDTYYNYSVIHNGSIDTIYDKQIFVRNNHIDIVDSLLDSKKDTVILDNYANKDYLTILGNDGVIYNLKNDIKLPASFTNKNIVDMTSNLNSNNSIILVLYDNGKVISFDYRTGTQDISEKATKSISLFDYFKENLSYRKALVNDTIGNYQESLELKELLEDKPIINEDDNYTTSDGSSGVISKEKNYISYYNASTNKFDIVDLNSIVNSNDDKEEVVTENNKIYTSQKLVSYYMHESVFDRIFGNVNVLVLFGLILFGIIVSLILWIRNIKTLKMSEENI